MKIISEDLRDEAIWKEDFIRENLSLVNEMGFRGYELEKFEPWKGILLFVGVPWHVHYEIVEDGLIVKYEPREVKE